MGLFNCRRHGAPGIPGGNIREHRPYSPDRRLRGLPQASGVSRRSAGERVGSRCAGACSRAPDPACIHVAVSLAPATTGSALRAGPAPTGGPMEGSGRHFPVRPGRGEWRRKSAMHRIAGTIRGTAAAGTLPPALRRRAVDGRPPVPRGCRRCISWFRSQSGRCPRAANDSHVTWRAVRRRLVPERPPFAPDAHIAPAPRSENVRMAYHAVGYQIAMTGSGRPASVTIVRCRLNIPSRARRSADFRHALFTSSLLESRAVEPAEAVHDSGGAPVRPPSHGGVAAGGGPPAAPGNPPRRQLVLAWRCRRSSSSRRARRSAGVPPSVRSVSTASP